MLTLTAFKLFSKSSLVLTIPDLTFELSSFIHIHGPNSTGKSLFLKALAGKYRDFTGTITFKKQPHQYHLKKNNIILIDSDLHILRDKTYLQNISLPFGKLTQTQKNRLLDMATMFDSIDLLNEPMLYSSHSQRMMMSLIRASLISPSLLLIDDIDSHFDTQNIYNAVKHIQYCQKSGMLIIATGKTNIENAQNYQIKSGELEKNE